MESFSHNRFPRLLSLITFCFLMMSMVAGARVASATPTFSAAFSPTTIGPGAISTLTFTIDNSANGTGFSSVAFSATLPAGMTVSNNSDSQTTCNSAILSAAGGGSSIAFSDGRLGSNQTCTVVLDVTSSTVGTHTLTTGDLTSSGGSSGTATANLTVDNSVGILNAAVSPSAIGPGESSTLTYTLDFSNVGSNVVGIGGRSGTVQSLPDNLVVADFPNTTSTCTGFAATPQGGDTSFTLIDISASAGSTCTISFSVTSGVEGNYTIAPSASWSYSETATFSTKSGLAGDNAFLSVAAEFVDISYSTFGVPGSSLTLDFQILNTDRDNAISDMNFTVDLNATLSGLTATSLPAANFCGTGSTISGSSTITVSGGNIASGESCSFSITVLVPANAAAGNYTTTTSVVNLTLGSATTKVASSAVLQVVKAPTLTISNDSSTIAAGGTFTSTFTLTNTDSGNALSDGTFTMDIAGVIPSATISSLPAANSCGSGSAFTATSNSNSTAIFKVAGANLVAGGSCNFDITVTSPVDTATGPYTFTTGGGNAVINGNSVPISAVSTSVTVESAPQLSMSLSSNSVVPGGTYDIQFTVSHSLASAGAASNGAFSLDLNTVANGMAVSSATQSDMCGSGSSASGTGTLSVTGLSLDAGNSCQFTVTVSVPNDNTLVGSKTLTTSTLTANVASLSLTSSTRSVTLLITGLTFSQEFLPSSTLPSGSVVSRYTIANAAGADPATNLSFTHSYTSIVSSLAATALPSSPCNGGSISGTTNLSFSGGTLNGGENCVIDVTLTVPSGATDGSYNSITSGLSATVDGNNIAIDAAASILTVETLTVALGSTELASTSASPIPVTINFSRDVINFITSDITVTNGSVTDFAGSGKDYTANITPTTDGNVTVAIASGVANDSVDNSVTNPAATSLVFAYTSTPAVTTPTLVISSASTASTTTGPVTYTVTYTNADSVNLTQSSVTLNKTGTANATVAVTNGSTSTPTVTLSSISGDGTLGISIAENTARHNSGGSAAAAGPSGTIAVDNTKPTVTISDSVAASVNSAFTATFTFSEDVTGFGASDIAATNANISNFSATSATVYTATVTPVADGSVTLNVAAGGAADSVGNTNTAAAQHSVTYDTTSPTVVVSGPTGPVNAAYTATITFNEDVTGFVESDISVTNANLSGFAATSASVYTVVVTPTSQGNVTLNVAASTAVDAAQNSNTVAAQYAVTYDSVQPSVTISGSTDPVNAAFTATITFSEDVTGFIVSDITAANASLSNFSATSATVYTVLVTPTGQGNVTLDVAASIAADSASNGNSTATQYSVLHDSVAPTVTISGPTAPTNAASFTATITFNEDVTGFAIGDISAANASLSNFSATSETVYTVDVTPTAQGNVTLDIAADAAIDSASNGNTVATQFSVVFDTVQPTLAITTTVAATNAAFTATFTFSEDVTGFEAADIAATNGNLSGFAATDAKIYTVLVTPTSEGPVVLNVASAAAVDLANNSNTAAVQHSVVYDTTSPTVVISGSATPVNAAFTATITFNENVTNFDVADITASNASLSNFATTSASVYTVLVTPLAQGNVTLDVAASAATDTAGNSNTAATQYAVLFDSIVPTVSISSPAVTSNSAFTATITFSEDVSGFAVDDISVTNASLDNFSSTSDSVYTVEVTPSTQGNVTLNIAASAATDSASNGSTAATQYTVLYDSIQPTLTISSPTNPVNGAFIATLTFSEDVTGFAMSDITASNAILSNFNSTSATVYTVVVTPSVEGAVNLDVAATAALDVANNGNVAANQFTVNYDPTPPTIDISGPTAPVNAAFTATFTFNEAVTGFEISDVAASNANLSNFIATSSTVYTATVTPVTEGTVTLDVANSVAVDSAGNSNAAAAQFTVTYDTIVPTINITSSATSINAAFTATFTFSETVTGFEIGDISVTNGNASNFITTSGAVYSATITPTSEGNVNVDVNAGVATDVAGNLNTAATQNTTTYDITSATVALSADSAFMQTTKTVTFTFSEAVTGFALADIGVTNGSAGSFSSVSSQVYTALITASSDGAVTVNIPAIVALDAAGNGNVAGNTLNLTSDTVAPTLSVSTPVDNSNSFGVDSNIELQFNETVSFNTSSAGTLKVIRLSDSNTIAESTDLTLSSGAITGQGTGTINGTSVTINLTQNLTAGANYAIQVSGDFLQDSAGNAYAGISNLTELNFVTMPSIILTVDRTQLIEEQLQTATATVSLQGPSSQAFSAVSDVTLAMSFNGSTATSNTDYSVLGLTNNSITISSGTSQSTFTMTTIDDSPLADEPEQIVVSVDSVTTNNAVEVLEQQVTVNIVENAAPEATNVPTSITLVEDVKSNIDLSGVTVVDSEGDSLVLTLTLTNGTLKTITGTSNGATVTRISDLSASVAGTISAINTLLDNQTAFSIIPPQNSTDSFTLSLSVSDGTETGPVQSIPVTITPVNDTPNLISGSEDTFDISGGTIGNATSYTEVQGSVTMTVNIDSGNLVSTDLDTLGGTSGAALYTDTATTNQVTVSFSDKVNLDSAVYFFNSGTVPSNITFTPTGSTGTAVALAASDFTVDNVGTKISFAGWTGITGFTISSTDGAFAPGLDTLVFSATPSNQSFQEDVQTSLDLSSLSLSDGDSTSLSLIISANQGTLALPTSNRLAKNGVSSFAAAIATLSNNVITVTGTAAEINSFLSVVGNVLYTPAANSNGNESGMITVSVNDNDGGGAVILQTILLDVTAINDAPEIANLNSDTVTFTQGGAAVNIDSQGNATVTDVDHTNLDGGSLTVSISSGGQSSEDVLSFAGSGVSLAGTASGSNVLVNNEVIGTLVNAVTEGNDLVVNFSNNATFTNVGSLLRSITYLNSEITNPTTTNRVISVRISDGDAQSEAALTTISFVPLDRTSNIEVSSRFTSISSLASTQSTQIALVMQAIDEGTDGVDTTITGINFGVGGTLNADNMSFSLRQVQIGNVLGTFQGQYNNGILSFSDSITIPNGSSNMSLELNVWFNENSNLTEATNVTFSINPNSDIFVANTGSQLGTIAAQPDTSLTSNSHYCSGVSVSGF